MLDDPLTTQPRKKGALFPMQSKKRRQEKRACLPCRQARTSRASSYCVGLFAMRSTCQELHNVNRRPLATMRAGLFRMQSRRRRWRGLHPVNTALPSMARHNESMQREPTPDCPGHAAPGGQCMQRQTIYANSPRIALYKPCRFALYPPRETHCKSCQRPFQTV